MVSILNQNYYLLKKVSTNSEKKVVSFGQDEEAPKLKLSDEDATLDITEPEVEDPMKELESKVAETLVLNL